VGSMPLLGIGSNLRRKLAGLQHPARGEEAKPTKSKVF